uniref:Uncharacterized protein LOC105051424 n=2 Tax=Elaeis guineensis var. tenera TaxID=51953 RepID=A0A6I9RQ75_ELAGV|nr:uncharacterized protein LOC105051424 [Elaeis guineensis]XP_029122397.1 uncharacterized protein LOC105051424 [Elaeis guineensis]
MLMAQDIVVAGDGASASIEEALPVTELCPVSGAGNAELTTDYDPSDLVDSVDSPEDRQSSGPDAGENGEKAARNGALETQEHPPEPAGNGGEGLEAKRMRTDLESEEKNGEVGSRGVNSGSVCGNKEKGLVRRYSRSEMEALRFVGTEEQRQKWKEVYQKLGSVVAQEYDGLWASNPQKKKHGGKKKEKETDHGNTYVGSENCTIVEDLCDEYENTIDEDDSSSDEYESIQRPAFVVEGEPDFDSGPPLDGLEYLRRVRWEAAQIPKVKVAKLNLSKVSSEQTPYMPKIPEIAKCPVNLLPSKDWENAFLANFSEIRQAFSLLENSSDQPSARKSSDNSCKQTDSTEQPKCIPTVSLIRGMDAVKRAATLRNYISMLESASILSRDDCLWLFALCAAVDIPLDGETCASLRCLLRICSSLLARKSEPDDEVAMLNILIAITGKYFGQLENKRS